MCNSDTVSFSRIAADLSAIRDNEICQALCGISYGVHVHHADAGSHNASQTCSTEGEHCLESSLDLCLIPFKCSEFLFCFFVNYV